MTVSVLVFVSLPLFMFTSRLEYILHTCSTNPSPTGPWMKRAPLMRLKFSGLNSDLTSGA